MKLAFRAVIYIFAIIGFVLVAAYISTELGLTKTKGIIDEQRDYFQDQLKQDKEQDNAYEESAWKNSEEWQVLKAAIKKDTAEIRNVSKETGIPSRMIVTPLVVEQMRLFHSEREIFKSVFAPLKILGNQSQFSWGVMGIKQDTAKEIEAHLKSATSTWYLGKSFEHVLDFKTTEIDTERFERLTDEKSRYYSYLYTALFIKQILAQWQKAGFPIDNRPEIINTLYNIGFSHSKPKANPSSGGAEIQVGTTTQSFGSFAKSFYYSNELVEEFPR